MQLASTASTLRPRRHPLLVSVMLLTGLTMLPAATGQQNRFRLEFPEAQIRVDLEGTREHQKGPHWMEGPGPVWLYAFSFPWKDAWGNQPAIIKPRGAWTLHRKTPQLVSLAPADRRVPYWGIDLSQRVVSVFKTGGFGSLDGPFEPAPGMHISQVASGETVTSFFLTLKDLTLTYTPTMKKLSVWGGGLQISDESTWHAAWPLDHVCHLKQQYQGELNALLFTQSFLQVNIQRREASIVVNGEHFGQTYAPGHRTDIKVVLLDGHGGTIGVPRPVPRLTVPPAGATFDNGATDGSDGFLWIFNWEPVPGASAYHLEANHPVYPEPFLKIRTEQSTFRHEQPVGYIDASQCTGWSWRVRALFGSEPGGWSEARAFRVATPRGPAASPGLPVLISPGANATMDNGRRDGREGLLWDFSWSPVAGATAYEILVSRLGATMPLVSAQVGQTSYRHQAESFVADGNRGGWYWKVRAITGGQPGLWSDPRSFVVEPEDSDPPE